MYKKYFSNFSRWTAYSRKHREHPFSWDFLYKLLCRLDDVWDVDALSKDEVCVEYVSAEFLLIVVLSVDSTILPNWRQ